METQVQTMRNENSGVSPKLRTYGQMRGWTLQKHTLANGGATLDLSSPTMDLANHTDGYYVGGYGQYDAFPVVSDVRGYQRVIGAVYSASNGLGYVGAWIDDDTVHVERVQWFGCRTRALMAAHEHGELAIYDVAAGADIRL